MTAEKCRIHISAVARLIFNGQTADSFLRLLSAMERGGKKMVTMFLQIIQLLMLPYWIYLCIEGLLQTIFGF